MRKAGVRHITRFTSSTPAQFRHAAAKGSAIVIPELEKGRLVLSAGSKNALKGAVASGRTLVVIGARWGVQLINDVFSKRLVYKFAHCTASRTSAAGGTLFSKTPGRLPYKNAVFGVKTSSLTSGMKSVYKCGGDRTTVVYFNHGRGKVVYLGFDWFANGPGEWTTVLDAALKMGGGSIRRSSSTRTSSAPVRVLSSLALVRRSAFRKNGLPSTKMYSYTFWYRPLQAPTGKWRSIFRRGVNDHHRMPGLWMYPRHMRLHVRASERRSWNSGCDPRQHLAIGRWVHIGVTVGSGALRVYFNGRLVCHRSYPNRYLRVANGPLIVGAREYAAARGYLSRLRFYKGSIPAAEVNRSRRISPRNVYARISSRMHNKCIEYYGTYGSRRGHALSMHSCHSAVWQRFRFENNGQIRSARGNLCMDIKGSSRRRGAPIILWTCHSGSNQKFYFDHIGRLRSRMNGFCIDIAGGSRRNRAKLHAWPCHHGHNQRWQLA